MAILRISALLIGAIMGCAMAQDMPQLRFKQLDPVRNRYIHDVLALALAETAAEGPYGLAEIDWPAVQVRQAADMADGSAPIDLMWSVGKPDWDRQLQPVEFPADRGLGGFRVFLIRAERQAEFERITNLEELKRFTACQGHDWGDVEILRHSGVPVETAPSYDGLFAMLDAGRCDYFPRSIDEAFEEIDAKGAKFPRLSVERNLLLYYPAPMLLYVSRRNTALALRLEQGLAKAWEDGSFKKFFWAEPMIRGAMSRAGLAERRVISLENPQLTPERAAKLAPAMLQPESARIEWKRER